MVLKRIWDTVLSLFAFALWMGFPLSFLAPAIVLKSLGINDQSSATILGVLFGWLVYFPFFTWALKVTKAIDDSC